MYTVTVYSYLCAVQTVITFQKKHFTVRGLCGIIHYSMNIERKKHHETCKDLKYKEAAEHG